MTRARVLVVEDDEEFQELYGRFFDLHADEFSWSLARTGEAALAALAENARPFDAALIDWRLQPGKRSGFDVLRAIRSCEATRRILAFMVTSNGRESDIQAALEAGADDYIRKPFTLEALAARLRGRLHRRQAQAPPAPRVLGVDGLRLDAESGLAALDGARIDLYPTECALLALFLEHPDRTLPADQLWRAVRGDASGAAGEVLGQHVRNLRKKLGAWGARIETLRGQGYLLNTRFPVSQD